MKVKNGTAPVSFFNLSDKLISRELTSYNKNQVFNDIFRAINIKQSSNNHWKPTWIHLRLKKKIEECHYCINKQNKKEF